MEEDRAGTRRNRDLTSQAKQLVFGYAPDERFTDARRAVEVSRGLAEKQPYANRDSLIGQVGQIIDVYFPDGSLHHTSLDFFGTNTNLYYEVDSIYVVPNARPSTVTVARRTSPNNQVTYSSSKYVPATGGNWGWTLGNPKTSVAQYVTMTAQLERSVPCRLEGICDIVYYSAIQYYEP
jgi:hypothetical protein